MSDRQGIEIDYCPQCRGVWLDRGELDKIVERSAAGNAPGAAPDYARHGGMQNAGFGHGHSGKPYRKRKSWLEDIFD
jgi:Zn-finger nucleic acid-binding protein